MLSVVQRQVSPDAGQGTSEPERQPAEGPTTPGQNLQNSLTSESKVAQSSAGARGAIKSSPGSEDRGQGQTSQWGAGSLLPSTEARGRKLLDGEEKLFLSSGGGHRVAFNWRSVERKALSPRKSHSLSLHKFAQVQSMFQKMRMFFITFPTFWSCLAIFSIPNSFFD